MPQYQNFPMRVRQTPKHHPYRNADFISPIVLLRSIFVAALRVTFSRYNGFAFPPRTPYPTKMIAYAVPEDTKQPSHQSVRFPQTPKVPYRPYKRVLYKVPSQIPIHRLAECEPIKTGRILHPRVLDNFLMVPLRFFAPYRHTRHFMRKIDIYSLKENGMLNIKFTRWSFGSAVLANILSSYSSM